MKNWQLSYRVCMMFLVLSLIVLSVPLIENIYENPHRGYLLAIIILLIILIKEWK